MERGKGNFRSFRAGARDFQQPYIQRGYEFGIDDGQGFLEDGGGNRLYLVTTSLAAANIVLPSADKVTGVRYEIKRLDAGANAINIYALSGSIDGTLTHSLATQFDTAIVRSDGDNYWLMCCGGGGGATITGILELGGLDATTISNTGLTDLGGLTAADL
jgi:hypothetical protein